MAIRRVITKEGLIKWEVNGYSAGRDSKRLRRRFDKKVEAENFQAELKLKPSELKTTLTRQRTLEETTFKDESDNWLLLQGKKFSPGHLKRAEGVLDELLPEIGALTLDHFCPAFLTKLQLSLMQEEVASATVNRKTEVIVAVLNFSAKQQRIPYNPAKGFEKLKENREEMKFWEQEEATSFLEFANSKYPPSSPKRWMYVVYLLAINTGLRAGEIWGLQLQDLVENGEVLFVRRQFDRIKKEFRPVKGKEPRRVPCNQGLRDELLNLAQSSKLSSKDIFFRNPQGQPICHDSFAEWLDDDVKGWGGRRIRFHDLRHTATTLMISHGIDLKTVKEIFGHKDIATTMKYSHLIEQSINKVARSFTIKPSITPDNPSAPKLRLVKSI